MTENEQTAKLVRELRRARPAWVVWKHADLMTAGIPDVQVIIAGRSTFFEAKKIERAAFDGYVTVRPRVDVPRLQWETLKKLGRGWLLVYAPRGLGLLRVDRESNYAGEFDVALASSPEIVERVVRICQKEEHA